MKKKFIGKTLTRIIATAMVVTMMAGTLAGCGRKDDKNSDLSGKESSKNKETVEESSKESESDFSISDISGVWLYVADTPAGDPCIFQLEIDKDGMTSYSEFTMTGDRWFENYCYDGMIEAEEGDSVVRFMISQLDENGTEIEKIDGSYKIIQEGETTIILKHKDGDELIDDYDSITFEKTDKAIKAGDSVLGDGEIEPGVYYDEEMYESDDYDSYFVGVALNSDGKALTTIQYYGWGTWTEDGSINIDHNMNWQQVIVAGDDCIITEDGGILVKAPEDVWPEGFDEFMETGKIPYWMTDIIWQDAYWSLLYEFEYGSYDFAIDNTIRGNKEALADLTKDMPAQKYYLYDLDSDEIPELIIRFGTCEADYFGAVFKPDEEGNLYYIGSVSLGHCELYGDTDNAGMIVRRLHMGDNVVDRMIIQNDTLKFVKLFEEDLDEEGKKEYTEMKDIVAGSVLLNPIEISNLNAISRFRENVEKNGIGYDADSYDYDEYDDYEPREYSYEQIKSIEEMIRHFVNYEATDDDRVILKAGVDGCPYARWYYYSYDSLRFAYYFDSKNGDVDNRYYFDAGQMVEWIEGNGNSDSNRIRHYASDTPLDPRWSETEQRILREAAQYRQFVY